jgi:hypothetical protein
MPLPPEHLLDELATAYVQAVAAVAGATIAVSRKDYGVDGTLKHIVKAAGDKFIESGYPVDFQLKGTTTATQNNSKITYDLKVRNYNLIAERELLASPYYLFLVCFSANAQDWNCGGKRKTYIVCVCLLVDRVRSTIWQLVYSSN